MRIKGNIFTLKILILVILATIRESDGAKKHQVLVRFSHIVCRVYNEVIVQSFNCSLTKHDISKELMLNIDIKLAQPITDVKLKNKMLLDRSGTLTKFYDMEMDVCETLTKRFEFYLFRMVLNEVHRTSNLPLKCPFNENVLYYMHNFTINPKYFPQFLPNMEWSSYLNISFNNRKLFGLDMFGSVTRKQI